jgi:hypothetical protein
MRLRLLQFSAVKNGQFFALSHWASAVCGNGGTRSRSSAKLKAIHCSGSPASLSLKMRACGFIPGTLSHSQVFKTDSVESARVCVKICQQMGPSIMSLVASGRMITQHRDRAPNNGQPGAQTMSNTIQRADAAADDELSSPSQCE